MEALSIPMLLLIIFGPVPGPSQHRLADFGRLSNSIGKTISLVDHTGLVREGVVTSTNADEVTMQFGAVSQSFKRTEIARAERLTDSNKDGAIKGALFGAVLGGLVFSGYSTPRADVLLRMTVTYAGIGYFLDATQSHREPIFSAAPASPRGGAKPPAPSVAFKVRF